MSGTDMQAAVTDMLAGLIQEGIADSGDYIDADPGAGGKGCESPASSWRDRKSTGGNWPLFPGI